ncbi:MAG: hypothetical protein LBK18_07240 [Prevotellaceae bacterium]|nr:hypothetical protein [Prevotellaceae bacterium]
MIINNSYENVPNIAKKTSKCAVGAGQALPCIPTNRRRLREKGGRLLPTPEAFPVNNPQIYLGGAKMRVLRTTL